MNAGVKTALAVLCLLAVAGPAGLLPEPPGELGARRYYIQVVQGSDSPTPKRPGLHAIGPNLHARLARIFRWQHYWEVSCREVTVAAGWPASLQVTRQRRLEIEFVPPHQREVRLYRDGALTRRLRCSLDHRGMAIQGWDGEERQMWFVVIRDDPPQYDEQRGSVE